jgi:hypothetical protein
MLEKQILVDYIEVTEGNMVQVRTKIAILEDGKQISSVLHRHVVAPGECTEAEDLKVQAICAAVHTPEVVAEYQSTLAQAQEIPA